MTGTEVPAVVGAAAAAGVGTYRSIVKDALKASGVVVRVSPADLLAIVERQESPLVVWAESRHFLPHRYLTSYKGLAFHAKSWEPIVLPVDAEIVKARKISVPG